MIVSIQVVSATGMGINFQINGAFLNVAGYTSRGYECGIYSALIVADSKALKQAHSKLRNCFSNAAIGKNSVVRNL